MDILPLFPVRGGGERPADSRNKESPSFAAFLAQSLEQVNRDQLAAEEAARRLALGEDVALHEVVLASQKAALSLEFAAAVRNKVLEAYQEIMRMQV